MLNDEKWEECMDRWTWRDDLDRDKLLELVDEAEKDEDERCAHGRFVKNHKTEEPCE